MFMMTDLWFDEFARQANAKGLGNSEYVRGLIFHEANEKARKALEKA